MTAKKEIGADILVRRERLGSDEEVRLLEARRRLFMDVLHDKTLPELGDLKFLYHKHHENSADRDGPFSPHELPLPAFLTSEGRHALHRQGLFWGGQNDCIAELRFPEFSCQPFRKITCLWGIDRDGDWLQAKIGIVTEFHGIWREKVAQATVGYVDALQLQHSGVVSLRTMWETLGAEIKQFAARRRELAVSAQSAADIVDCEEAMYASYLQGQQDKK